MNKIISIIRNLTLSCLVLISCNIYAAGDNPRWAKSLELEVAGKIQEAAAEINALTRSEETAEYALNRLGWLNYLQGNYNKAIKQYKKALGLNENSIDSLLGLTLPLLAQHRWKETARYTNQVLKKSAWNFTAHSRLLAAEEGQRKWSKLKKHASELSDRYPTSATPLVYLARAEAWMGNKSAAKIAYARVLRRMPAHLEANAFMNNQPADN